MTGKFLTLEGIEGAGKSTSLQYIATVLAEKGIEFVQTREPGGTPLSEALRDILLDIKFDQMHPDTELLLMFAARNQHLQQKILPALKAGKWVISDRFTDATYAYQGGARGLDIKRIEQIECWVQQGLQPDMTFIFDLSVEKGFERVRTRGEKTDRFEKEKKVFFSQVRKTYLSRAEACPARYAVLDAAKNLKNVQAQIDQVLEALF